MKKPLFSKSEKNILLTVFVAVFVVIGGITFGSILSKYLDDGGIAARTTVDTSSTQTTVQTENPMLSSTSPTKNSTGFVTESDTQQTSGTTTVRFMCAGDSFVQSAILQQARAAGNNTEYKFDFLYKEVEDIISEADFSFVSLLTPVTSSVCSGEMPYSTPTSLGDCFYNMGFRIINAASRYCLDMNENGAQQAISFWKSKQDTVLTGLYSGFGDMTNIKTNSVHGITFSHIGITQSLDLDYFSGSDTVKVFSPQAPDNSGSNYLATLKSVIERAKSESDIVCVYVSFNASQSSQITEFQKNIVKILSIYGADLIIGTGTNTLQPIEYLQRPDKTQTLVLYSLGNLISEQDEPIHMVGAIADITFEKNLETSKVSIQKLGLIPIVTHFEKDKNNIRTIPFYAYNDTLASSHGIENFTYAGINKIVNSVIQPEFIESNPYS